MILTKVQQIEKKIIRNVEIREQHSFSSGWENWLNNRRALPIRINDTEPVRLNILIPELSHALTGGPLSILRFALLAKKAGINVRLINYSGGGITFEQLSELLKKYDGEQEVLDG